MADQLITVALSELNTSPDNLREDFGDLAGLAKTLDEQGVIEPPVIRKRDEGGYWIVAGERRTRALRLLGRKKAEVILREYTREQAFAVTVAENAHRESFNPMELANSFAKMRADFGYNMDTIAERLKLKPTVVGDLLQLHDYIVDSTKKALLQKRIGLSSAVYLSRVKGERLQTAALNDALKLSKNGEPPAARAVRKLVQDKYLTTARKGRTKHQREAQKHGPEAALRRRVVPLLLSRVGELAERKPHLDETDLRFMAQAAALNPGTVDTAREVYMRRELNPDKLSKVGAAQLRSLTLELALAGFVGLIDGEYSPGTKAVAKAYGLSLSELEKTVTATQTAEALFTK